MDLVDCVIDRLATRYGAVAVDPGERWADGLTRITVPTGREFMVNDDGVIVKERLNFSIRWKEIL